MSTLNFRKKFGAVPSGTITGAAVGQINTRGLIDAFITSPKPEIAFFRSEIQRSGVFATEIVTQPLIGTMTYDTELSLLAHKTADMLQSSHAVITRPGIIGVRRAESSGSRPYGSSAGSRPDRNGRKKRFSARDKIAAKRYGRYPSRKNESHGRGSRPPVRRSRHNELQPVYHDDEDHYEDYGSTKEGNLYEDYSQYYDDEEDELDEEDEEDDEVYATYVNSFGHAVIERATCTLAGLLAQTLTGRFMHAWSELTAQPGKEHDDVIGKYATHEELLAASKRTITYYVELPFSYSRFTSRAISLVGMRFHPLTLSIATTSLQNVIQVSHPDVEVINIETGQPLSHNDISVAIDMTYVYLGATERNHHINCKMQCMWEQVQYVQQASTGPTIKVPLTLGNPVRALIFGVQRKEAMQANDTFDYGTGKEDEEPIEYAQLILNTTPRFSREGGWFRRMAPLLYFNRKLDNKMKLYCMCFGLDGFSEYINGTQNFSRLEIAEMVIDLHERLHAVNVMFYMWAFSLNVYEMEEGTIQMLFQGS
jgi:hypothetical protein